MRSPFPFLASLLLLLSGCTLSTDYFKEYRDLNLLDNYGFSAIDTAGNAKWKLATSTDFMTWEKIDYAASLRDSSALTPLVGPDGISPVYRLEIKNLIPNGDFEEAALTAEGQTTLPPLWSTTDYNGNPVTATVKFGASPSSTGIPGSIQGRSLGWEALQAGDQLRIDLYNAATVSGTRLSAWTASQYRFRCAFINVKDKKPEMSVFLYTGGAGVVVQFQLANPDWTMPTQFADGTADNSSLFGLSQFFLTAPTDSSKEGRIVAFGPSSTIGGTSAAVIDNVRLVPDDQTLGVKAVFSNLDSGSKPLLPGSKPGMYVFTVAVHDDPTATTLNRFHPTNFTVLLKGRTKNGMVNQLLTVTRPTLGWSTWTTLVLSTGFDFVNSDADLGVDGDGVPYPALDISLWPTVYNTDSPDVGSLLVTQPTLTFNP